MDRARDTSSVTWGPRRGYLFFDNVVFYAHATGINNLVANKSGVVFTNKETNKFLAYNYEYS